MQCADVLAQRLVAGRLVDHLDAVDAGVAPILLHLRRQASAVGPEIARRQYVWARLVDRHQQPLGQRSEEHTSELQSLMRISYAVFCLKKKKQYIKLS